MWLSWKHEIPRTITCQNKFLPSKFRKKFHGISLNIEKNHKCSKSAWTPNFDLNNGCRLPTRAPNELHVWADIVFHTHISVDIVCVLPQGPL